MGTVAPTYEEFIAQYPEFTTVLQSVIEAELSLSSRVLSEATWGSFFSDGVGLDVAHNLAIAGSIGSDSVTAGLKAGAGVVNSVSAAGVSVSFNSAEWDKDRTSENWYNRSIYGQRFLRLQSIVVPLGELTA